MLQNEQLEVQAQPNDSLPDGWRSIEVLSRWFRPSLSAARRSIVYKDPKLLLPFLSVWAEDISGTTAAAG